MRLIVDTSSVPPEERLFADEGTSVGAWIRARRLARVRRDLADPALTGKTIARIGARWGFSSPPHLSRAYRAAYGESPRAAHRAGPRIALARTRVARGRTVRAPRGGARERIRA